MELTQLQKTAVKTYIESAPACAPYLNGQHQEIARLLNVAAAPDFVVWKSLVENAEVGRTFVASSLSAMTSTNNDRLMSFALWNPAGVQPSRADHRQFFEDVFSPASGAATRTALNALWRRKASVVEKLLATGAGSDASPASLGAEGPISEREVERCLVEG